MKTKIIAGFPGVGKTTAFNILGPDRASDSDSSKFSWMIDDNGNKVRNPEFPNNYIEHIKSLIGIKEYIFVSTHESVRNALRENNLDYTIVCPYDSCKDIYLANYLARGNDNDFINMMDNKWGEFTNQLKFHNEDGTDLEHIKYIHIPKNLYLSDILKFI